MQAVKAASSDDARSKLRRLADIEEIGMWLLMLEAGVALFLLVFIVWWTASGRRPDRPQDSERNQDEPEQ